VMATINRLELFCRTCSYLYRFNCIGTLYMEMNFIGIVLVTDDTYLQTLVGCGFGSKSMLLYWLVCHTELYFEQDCDSENVYCKILAFISLFLFSNTVY
jgi:hypothetical protein